MTVDYNNLHIELLLDNESLSVFLLVLGLVSSLLYVESESESESYITTDSQPASLFWNKAPIWGLRPDFYYCQTVSGLFM
jgi:hypothetical protein